MKKIFKGLGIGFVALALTAVVGVSKANAALTLSALAATSDGALTLTSAGALGLVAGANAINIGADATDKTITVGSATGVSALNLLSGTGGVNITGTLSATSPKITTSIKDANGNVMFGFSPQASAVNYLQFLNSPTATNLAINTIGTDTNISLSFNTKGTGVFNFQNQTATDDTMVIAPHVGGAAFFAGTLTSADLTAARTWTFPNATGTVLLEGQAIGATTPAAGTFTTLSATGAISAASALNKGTVTLVGGAGTATVASGAICTATDTTAPNAVKASVAATTLTLAGTGTDVIAYLCF